MDSVFENVTVLNKNIVLDACDCHYKHRNKRYRMLTLIFGLIFLLGAVCTLSISFSPVGIVLVVASIFMIFLYFKAYLLHFKKYYASVLALHPSGEIRYTFDHEGLGARNKLLYTQITQVLETKRVIMLYIEDAFVFVDRAGFTNGTYEGFKEFLKEKCVNATKSC